jgi:cell division transport system permease protein
MRALSAAVYFLRQGLSNLARHPLHASVGVLTLAVSLILVGFLGLFMWKANVLVDRLAGGLQLTVYLDPEITPGGADELMKVLREQWAEVDSVTFHSEVEDKTRNAEPYLEVTLDIEHLDEVRAEQLVQWFGALDRVQGVDDVLFGSEKISVAFSLLRGAQNVGLFISIVIVLAALFFVITTTRLIVEGRRREIEILLLVGATRNFIRIPHYIEGGLQGTLAGLMAFSVVWFMQRQLLSSLRSTSQLLVPIDLLPTGMVAWFLLGGIFLGLLGSALGMARYLKLSK